MCIWDPKVSALSGSKCTRYYIMVEGEIKGVAENVCIVNIYAPQDISLKKDLWEELYQLKCAKSGIWIFLGDFNCVRNPNERKNSEFCSLSATDFNNFIMKADLSEYRMGGSIFTYHSKVGNKCSKIDRVLVGHEFTNQWPMASLTALPKRYSDHRPIILSCVDIKFGPKPFRFLILG